MTLALAATLAGGARGGLLTPSLSTGAFLGNATGLLWSHIWPGAPIVDFAVIAAAAMLAVTQRAPLIGIVLTLEFIRGGLLLMPAMVVSRHCDGDGPETRRPLPACCRYRRRERLKRCAGVGLPTDLSRTRGC